MLRYAFDDQTDAIFESSMHDVVSISELLEPVTGPPYVVHRYTRPGLRRGDEDSLIGDGPPKGGARLRARSLTWARRAALGTDLSKGNVGEISLQLRNEARADFSEFLRSSGACCPYDAFLQWIDSDLAAKELVTYCQQVYDDGGPWRSSSMLSSSLRATRGPGGRRLTTLGKPSESGRLWNRPLLTYRAL